ncbi:unnamed protein product [Fusarium graminearum]|uniref:Chromosome 1, complete genome n=1 Tax=Gibberella zeae (strain ATCC MYA-4620 / CBS 123657 / FGSC 9075 / NRRL 31084 / PH-1) TaxID=229533 RepID=A0A098D179_GIBZE|nr:unnamed protein product [Fusarium graminearum]CZS75954.1 unnamed protein product [Fusarium graminearum]
MTVISQRIVSITYVTAPALYPGPTTPAVFSAFIPVVAMLLKICEREKYLEHVPVNIPMAP